MDRKEWLKERHKGLGGSDSPVVLGVNPWKKPVDLWAEKRGLIEDDQEPSPAMRRGTALEPIVADMYTQAAGVTTAVEPEILVHPEHPWMLANIDRHILTPPDNPGVLEIKCPGISRFGKIQRGGLPDYYQVQLQHYLAVTGRKWGAFAVFNAERSLRS